uniref:IRS-type PTB domain-containing protein n=1 Tax=Echinostoma caproni TaxID=27848 RepID=A0A183A5A0_9TREM
LRVDAGRRCSTGDGRFFFRCSPPNGQPVDMLVTQIRQLALEAKQRLKRTQLASSNLELSQSRNTLTHTPDTPTGEVGNTDTEKEFQSAGTLPRARSKRTKPALHPPIDRSTKVNGFGELSAPKATPEPSDDPDAPKSDPCPDECEVVRATPVKATKSPADSPTSPANLYDNLPRPPRKAARLPGAVNVLPLPVRAKAKESNGLTRDHSHEPRSARSPRPNEVTTSSNESEAPPIVTRPASVPRIQSSNQVNQKQPSSTILVGNYAITPHIDDDTPPPGPAPPPPSGVGTNSIVASAPVTNGSSQDNNNARTQTNVSTNKPKQLGSVEPARTSLWKTTPSPTPPTGTRLSQSEVHGSSVAKPTGASSSTGMATVTNNTTGVTQNGPTVTGAQTNNNISPTVVMRVPPFTAPKPATVSTPHSISTPVTHIKIGCQHSATSTVSECLEISSTFHYDDALNVSQMVKQLPRA